MAADKGVKPSQLALAWLLAQGEDIVPIPGTKRTQYLLENIEAAQVQLTQTELDAIRKLIQTFDIAGTRYDERGMKAVNA